MSEIIKIEDLKKLATPVVNIPNFDNTGTIAVRLQKPKLLRMAQQGTIPNHLIKVAATMVSGQGYPDIEKQTDQKRLEIMDQTIELYCRACMVEPTYEEMEDYLTDEQRGFIFDWAIGEVESLESFRAEQTNGTNNHDGKEIQQETE